MTTQTISDRMQKRQATARSEIQVALWGDSPDLDAVADMGLASGIPPAEIDTLAGKVDTAKRTLAVAESAHKAAPAVDKAVTAARAAVTDLEAQLVELQAQMDAAAEKLDASTAEKSRHSASIGDAAAAFRRGEIPTGRAPKWLAAKVKQADEAAAKQARASRAAALESSRRYRENRVEGLQAELDGIDTKDPHAQSVVATPAGLVDFRQSLQSRIDSEKAELKKIEAELKQLAR